MPIDTRFPTWMLPTETPMDALFKGVAAGSQIAQNRYRNQAMYHQVQQFQQAQALREKELLAENESRTLANEVHRTKLDHDAEDYSTARAFYPKFAAAAPDDVIEMERPVFHDPEKQSTAERAITSKWAKGIELRRLRGMTEYGNFLSKNPDVTDPVVASGALKLIADHQLGEPVLNHFQSHQAQVERIKIARDVEARRVRQAQQSTGMVDQLDSNGNVIAKQFVDENTGEPIIGWRAVPGKNGQWHHIKTDDASEPTNLTPAQNISRLNTLARIEQSNLKALEGATGKEAKAQAVSSRKRLDTVTEELKAIGARPAAAAPSTGPAARATDTGVQHGPPAPAARVRVRNKATGQTGWWEGGSPPDEYEVIQ